MSELFSELVDPMNIYTFKATQPDQESPMVKECLLPIIREDEKMASPFAARSHMDQIKKPNRLIEKCLTKYMNLEI